MRRCEPHASAILRTAAVGDHDERKICCESYTSASSHGNWRWPGVLAMAVAAEGWCC